MHICFLTHEFPKPGLNHGGVGTFVKNLGKYLVQAGHQVSVVGTNNSDQHEEEIVQGVRVYRIGKPKLPGLNWFLISKRINKKLREIHQVTPLDVVEGNELSLAFIDKIESVRYLVRMHGGHHFFSKYEKRPTEPWKVFQEKRSFYKADAIAAVSHFVAKETCELLNSKRVVSVIHNFIDTQQLKPTGNPPAHGRILFVGTLVEKKGIRQLLLAMDHLVDQFPGIELKVAGRTGKDPKTGVDYMQVLQESITEKTKPHIYFTGPLPHDLVLKEIEQAEICCYPSHMEAMPLAWLEAMCLAKPFVASISGPGPELITNYQTGILCDPENPKEIAEAVAYCLNNKEKAKEMGQKARENVIARFDAKVLVQKNIDFYQSLIS
jgi:glycosyltransferase involved in cell wall biosynthesis